MRISKFYCFIYKYAKKFTWWFERKERLIKECKERQISEEAKIEMDEFLKKCGPEFMKELEQQDFLGYPMIINELTGKRAFFPEFTILDLRNARRES